MPLCPPTSLALSPDAVFASLRERASAIPEAEIGRAGEFVADGREYNVPRVVVTGTRVNGLPPVRVGLFAGLHGDEPAGCTALVRLLEEIVREPDLVAGYQLAIYPVCNPTGLEDGTRHNRAGLDLNREFWRDSDEPEVRILERELQLRRFEGIITLHADDTCDGLYGYAHGCTINEALLKPALRASERVLPRDCRLSIDGFAASEGIIGECFQGVLAAPPDQHPRPFDLIFETPARAPLALQEAAAVVALRSILDEYRGFIAQGENL